MEKSKRKQHLQNHFPPLSGNEAAGFFNFLKDCFERENANGLTLLDVSGQAGAFNVVV